MALPESNLAQHGPQPSGLEGVGIGRGDIDASDQASIVMGNFRQIHSALTRSCGGSQNHRLIKLGVETLWSGVVSIAVALLPGVGG
jgi:hypothetical protein